MPANKKAVDGLTARMPVTAMTQEMYDWIEQRAHDTNSSRGDVVREAVELLIKRTKRANKPTQQEDDQS